jgi:hypothetical protein
MQPSTISGQARRNPYVDRCISKLSRSCSERLHPATLTGAFSNEASREIESIYYRHLSHARSQTRDNRYTIVVM